MPDRLSLYAAVAEDAADVVVRRYSTSFGLATRLLPPAMRTEIRNIYALVRLADEVVDGAAEQAGAAAWAGDLLDALEAETDAAVAHGYSTNVLVHAFAGTARRAGFGRELTAPFFASMRTDLHRTDHDAASLASYVYGSAEVVGLMCLRVFVLEEPAAVREERYAALTPGARALGAAFQKVNFLRDLAEDGDDLGRSYLVGVERGSLTEEQKRRALEEIRSDLVTARAAIPGLPAAARPPVALACALFTELAHRLAVTPAAALLTTRVSVPGPVKARIVGRVLAEHGVGGRGLPAPLRRVRAGWRR